MSLSMLLRWLVIEQHSTRRALIVGLGIVLIEAILLVAAGYRDSVFWLPCRGLGLFQHFGIPAILFADFAVLAMLSIITKRFLQLSRRLPITMEPENRRFIRRGINRAMSSITLKGPALSLFLWLSGFGIFFLSINSYQTINPIKYYGNDVFDSLYHPYSYAAMRVVLGFSWVILYPYTALVLFAIAGNIYRVITRLIKRGRLTYREFHPDGCVGFAYIGTMNFLVILETLVLYASLAVVTIIHHKINILQISGFVILSVSLIAMSYLVSWPVTSFLSKAGRKIKISGYRASRSSDSEFAILRLIWILTDKPFSPYSAHQKMAINIVRILPITVAGFRLWIYL